MLFYNFYIFHQPSVYPPTTTALCFVLPFCEFIHNPALGSGFPHSKNVQNELEPATATATATATIATRVACVTHFVVHCKPMFG